MATDPITIKSKIQQLLGQEITQFSLKASGLCNDAYYIETSKGNRYIVKQEKPEEEIDQREQNSLPIEARLIQTLAELQFSIPLPRVVFISEDPVMYGYEYIDGEPLTGVWPGLTEDERLSICRALGTFHAELGQKVSKEMAAAHQLKIDESDGLHDYAAILSSKDVPSGWKQLAKEAKDRVDQTLDQRVFQFIHNDVHHKNVLVRNKMIAGIIDFGDAEYGEVANEFPRYIRDYPHHFDHIVAAYEQASGHTLSRDRLISNAFLSRLIDSVDAFRQGGAARQKVEASLVLYRELLNR